MATFFVAMILNGRIRWPVTNMPLLSLSEHHGALYPISHQVKLFHSMILFKKIYPGFQSQGGGTLYLRASLPACNDSSDSPLV